MNPWKPILAALIIFAAGVVTGGLLVGYSDHRLQKARRLQPHETSARPPGNLPPAIGAREPRPVSGGQPNRIPRVVSEEFFRRLETEVGLTSGQRERVEEIIAQGQARNKEIWERVTPEFRREMIDTQKRIRDILTVEQRAKFEELMKQNRPALRRGNEEPLPGGNRPREQRRPLPPRDAPENTTPQPNP